jgi:cation transport ATPase
MAEGDKPTSEDRPFWSLSTDDHHALWVNFIGTVASALVIAATIGGAIALAREYTYYSWWQLLIPTLVLPLLALWQFWAYRITKRRGRPMANLFLMATLVAGFLAVFEVLIWIGRAAGIK